MEMATTQDVKNRVRVSTQTAKIMDLVAEARVTQLIEEEKELISKDESIRALVAKTQDLIRGMEIARDAGYKEIQRELRNDIVVANMRLVTQVLKKYGSFSQDKFQNGSVGLLKAAETYKSAKGVPFANYACFCIESEIRMAWGKQNRAFEGKKQGFLDSLDAPSTYSNGDEADKHDSIEDVFSMQEFDAFINEAEIDTLFYDIIIPCIEQYGNRSIDIDMDRWKELETQYFIELSMEQSQRQRLTFSAMALELGTTPQNLRIRHKKVVDLIRRKCREYGYDVEVSPNGRARVVHNF